MWLEKVIRKQVEKKKRKSEGVKNIREVNVSDVVLLIKAERPK